MTGLADLLAPLEGKSPTVYLAAAALLAVFAANTAARTFADAGVGAVHSIFGPAGFFVGLVGLAGLYPALADEGGWLARVAGALAVPPLVGWFVVAVAGIGSTAGVLPGASVILPGPAFALTFLTTVLAYVLFAATSLRSGVHARVTGVVLLAPAATFLALIVGVAVVGPAPALEFVVDSGHAVGHLAIGAALWTGGGGADHAEPSPDATA